MSDPLLLSYVERDIIAFGRSVKRLDLATVVIDLYDSAHYRNPQGYSIVQDSVRICGL